MDYENRIDNDEDVDSGAIESREKQDESKNNSKQNGRLINDESESKSLTNVQEVEIETQGSYKKMGRLTQTEKFEIKKPKTSEQG